MPDFVRTIPAGDNRERQVCSTCQYVAYENPKIVVGSVVVDQGRVLLCRRAIEPRMGFWTLPAGYMELHETTAEGAKREAMEEAGADIELEGILALYDVSRIGQVQVMYKARFAKPGIEAGEESLEVRMFAWDEIPWGDLAFPTVRWALNAWRELGAAPLGVPASNPVDDRRGTKRIDAVPAL
jgi:ADP-ribose pyrophosphatase YjhB (NUDIX family)